MSDGSGEGVTFLIHPSLYTPEHSVPRTIYGDLDRLVRPDLFFHYAGPVCAQRWLDVCGDPDYGHEELMRRTDLALPDLVGALRQDQRNGDRIAVTSLGPGDGELDAMMLNRLSQDLEIHSYRGLDFSVELLRKAVRRILEERERMAGGARFPVSAVGGDFTGLGSFPSVPRAESCTHLYSLTGFTLGNYDETDLLRSVRGLMRPGDYLFLDARLHFFGTGAEDVARSDWRPSSLLGNYDLESVRRFVFGPVEVATHATADDVEIDFEIARPLTAIPHALNMVIHCRGLDTRMRLTGEAVRRERLDLAVTTRYSLPDLAEWFPSQGFTPVWQTAMGDVAFFLLRRD